MIERRESAVSRVAASPYWREPEARVVVEGWERSGLPVAAFAELYDLSEARVLRWSKRLSTSQRLEFQEVELRETSHRIVMDPGADRFEVELSNGRCVRLPREFAGEELRRLLDVVEGRL